MSTDTEAPIYNQSAFEFKSTSFSVPVLAIATMQLKQIEHQLKEKIAQAPDFFRNSPILIDLHECNKDDQEIDLTGLVKLLHAQQLFPIAVSGGNEKQNALALELKIPLHTLRSTQPQNNTAAKKLSSEQITDHPQKETDLPPVENMLISQPIRSGQRIYSKGDLIILSHVSAGAEIMAEGNIHVYGTLRGRALAGVQGDITSRIFCSILQAELISIAGHYKVNEELANTEDKQPKQIFLQDQSLIIKNL